MCALIQICAYSQVCKLPRESSVDVVDSGVASYPGTCDTETPVITHQGACVTIDSPNNLGG